MRPEAEPPESPTRRAQPVRAIVALTALVAAMHLWLTGTVLDDMQALQPDARAIQRMEATYVSEVKLTQPPAMVAPPAAPPTQAAAAPVKRRKVVKPAKAASAPQEAASAVAQAASEALPGASGATDVALAANPPSPQPPPSAPEPATVAQAPSAAASSATNGDAKGPAFEWPAATRVSYKLEGFFRGPVYGQSSVEWVRKDQRYQVHVEASVGPSFAPLGSWRLTSEGDILPEGLYPRLYENVNRLLIKTSSPKLIKLDADQVIQPDGKQYPRPEGIQDPASFMIQVAYQFVLKPERLRPGASFEMTVVTLRKPEPLIFDVVAEELLDTPMGRIPTLHVRPRKAVVDGGALPADVWFAPGLQYLPVRIYMKMKDEVWMDMRMDRAPQQNPGGTSGTSGTGTKAALPPAPSAQPAPPEPPAPTP